MCKVRKKFNPKVMFFFVFFVSLISTTSGVLASPEVKSLKVLAIGNSFSQDAMQHLYHIAADGGLDEIIVANLYIGGSSLEVHWSNARLNSPAYRYDKNTDGNWRSERNKSILYGLLDEEWDIITVQQVSGLSGVSTSFNEANRLNNLINYVNEHKLNPDAKIAWHLTWAYQADSTHKNFPIYDRDQLKMYNAIIQAVQSEIVNHEDIDIIIPAGTAIQNVRTSYIGDTLTRDGYHLSYNLGRYIAGLTWFHSLTGLPIDEITYVPHRQEIPETYLPIIKEAVKAAVDNPFAITPSTYVERPVRAEADFDYTNYELLDWEPVGSAYWNSRNTAGLSTTLISRENSTASNLPYFVSSGRMFTKEDIPVGSIIEIDEGYCYRPEGWVTLTTHTSREDTITAPRVVVTDEWWDNYKYRAFNVSAVGSRTDLSNAVEETAARFRIWVPKVQEQVNLEQYSGRVPEVVAMKTGQAPTIDGELDDKVWLDAAIFGSKVGGFINHTGTSLAQRETIAYIAYDDEQFYIAIVAFKDDVENLVASSKLHDKNVHKDDSVEVFWDVDHNHNTFYHIINNATGTKADVFVKDWSWNPQWEVATKVLSDRWITEIAIPFTEMKLTGAPKIGEIWGFNVNRNDYTSDPHSGWATTYGSFLSPQHFGHLIFGGYLK